MDSLIESHLSQIKELETKFASQLHRTENDQDEAKVLELENTIAQHITAKEALQQEIDKMQRVFQEEKDQTAADVKKMSNSIFNSLRVVFPQLPVIAIILVLRLFLKIFEISVRNLSVSFTLICF
mgnify:CR=1 FL=1